MAELVRDEKEHSDWFPRNSPYFAIRNAKMDRSRTDFNDWSFWKDIQKNTFCVK